MNAIKTEDEIGQTKDGQPVVAEYESVTRRTADADAYEDIGSSDTGGSASVWREDEGDVYQDEAPLRERPSKRAWCLSNDKMHPASAHYKYDTPHSQSSKTDHHRSEVVSATFAQFTTPTFVSEKEVKRAETEYDATTFVPYGGHRFLTFVAILDVWGYSNEDVFTDDTLRQEVRDEFDDVQVGTAKLLRKAFEVRQ